MPTDKELMQQALASLEGYARNCRCEGGGSLCDAGKALRARLAQLAQEPVDKAGSPCPEFWDWLPKAYRDGDKGNDPKFTKYNMEVAYLAGKQAQPEPEPEKSQDKPCVEDDGCPTEKAVLQRFWREHQAQPEPEPVAWFMEGTYEDGMPSFTQVCESDPEFYVPLYTAPPQREWVGLTDGEAGRILMDDSTDWMQKWCAIEAKLKEKNDD